MGDVWFAIELGGSGLLGLNADMTSGAGVVVEVVVVVVVEVSALTVECETEFP